MLLCFRRAFRVLFTYSFLLLTLSVCQNPETVCPEIDVALEKRNIIRNESITLPNLILNTSKTFIVEIKNEGGATLKIGEIVADNPQFSVRQIANNRLTEAQKSTFEISFTPKKIGAYRTKIRIPNNDFDENPFEFSLEIGGIPEPEPEISLRIEATDLIDAQSVYSMGESTVSTLKTVSCMVKNLGAKALELGDLALSDPNFILSKKLDKTTLNPSESTTFEVSITPSEARNYETTVSLNNDDADENPFTFILVIKGLPLPTPDITVSLEGRNLASGEVIDMGTITQSFNITKRFVIGNAGTAQLILDRAESNNSRFVPLLNNPKKLDPSATTSLDLTFLGTGEGERSGEIKIYSNDPDENPFVIKLLAKTVKPRLTIDFQNSEIPDGLNTVVSDSGPNRTLFLANFKVNDPENLVNSRAELVVKFRFSNGAGGTTRRKTTDNRTGKIEFDAFFDNMDYFTSIRFGNDSDYVEFEVYLETDKGEVSNQERFVINKPIGANRERASEPELR